MSNVDGDVLSVMPFQRSRNIEMVEVCSQLDEESNPVLFRIKVKDF